MQMRKNNACLQEHGHLLALQTLLYSSDLRAVLSVQQKIIPMRVLCRETAPGILVGSAGMQLDWADRDWLGMDPLKEESAEALGAELGLPSASLGFFFVRDAHLFLTALSVLQQGSSGLAMHQVCQLLKNLAW